MQIEVSDTYWEARYVGADESGMVPVASADGQKVYVVKYCGNRSPISREIAEGEVRAL